MKIYHGLENLFSGQIWNYLTIYILPIYLTASCTNSNNKNTLNKWNASNGINGIFACCMGCFSPVISSSIHD